MEELLQWNAQRRRDVEAAGNFVYTARIQTVSDRRPRDQKLRFPLPWQHPQDQLLN